MNDMKLDKMDVICTYVTW